MDEKVFTKSTQYFVEDALWMTAYANAEANALPIKGADDTAAATIKAAVPVENAWFNGTWLEEDGTEIGAAGANNSNVGDVDAVYAKVVYDIYVINLKADQNAISSITIDGSVMSYGMIAEKDPVTGEINYYYGYTAVVDAGAHTIQYQLANGYSGQGVLEAVSDNITVSGLTFNAAGTPASASGIDMTLQLTGFEKTGYVPESPDTGDSESDSGMTITDYLLIVLVVLIIVMAIIVAMRLMRS